MSDTLNAFVPHALNSEQAEAVRFTGPALLVAAGPGSGKTRVITYRIAYSILTRRIEPRRILAVSFTNRASREMAVRLKALLGPDVHVPVGTFHWMCAGILRRHIGVLGHRSDFRVLQPSEARKILHPLLPETKTAGLPVATWADALSGLKSGLSVEQQAERSGIEPHVIAAVAETYARALRERNALDLDDLPCLALTVLREHPHVRQRCRSAVTELLVDEYQDTNRVQQELVELLAPAPGTVVVVGDEDQAIYGWRHADAGGFERFRRAFPHCETVTLEESYRHHKFVARAANALIAHNANRTAKEIKTHLPAGERTVCFVAADERDEADWIAQEAQRLASGADLSDSDIAVLYRVNAQSRILEDAFVRHSVPYRVLSGRSFYIRPHVQRVVAYLRLALDDGDDAAAGALVDSLPGIGVVRGSEVRDWAAARGESLLDACRMGGPDQRFPRRVREALQSVAADVEAVRARRSGPVVSTVAEAIRMAEQSLDAAGLLTDAVVDDLAELRSIAEIHAAARGTLRSLVESLAIDSPESAADDGVHLMSLHAAKGLEYRVVFLCGLEEGVLPHERASRRRDSIEEERRLCYVGMTRAMQRLYLSYAQMRLQSGQRSAGGPSRFIKEIGLQNMVVRVSSASQRKPRLSGVAVGERVRHIRWGSGTVELVQGTGHDTLITVAFDLVGRKRLQLCHAPLSHLAEGGHDVAAG